MDEKILFDQMMGGGELIDRAMQAAVRDALWEHKNAGRSVPIWEYGQVTWTAPEDVDPSDTDETFDDTVKGPSSVPTI